MTSTIIKPMIVNRDSNLPTEFKPYFEVNKPVSELIQTLDSYGAGINDTYYNYIDYERKVYVQKCKRVRITTDLIGKSMGTNASGTKLTCGLRLVETTYPSSGGTETGFYKFVIDNFITYNLRSPNTINSNMVQNTPFKNYSSWTSYSQLKEEQVAIQNNNFFIVISKEKASTVAEFRTWLQNNPFDLVYALNDPIEKDISGILALEDEFIKVQEKGKVFLENNLLEPSKSEISYEVKIV